MAHEYNDAYKYAPDEVKQLIDKFRALPEDEKDKKPLLYYIIGTGTPKYKMEKADSDYIDESKTKGQSCGNCEFAYYKPAKKKFICSQVRGEITKPAWCRLYKKGSM